MNELSLHSFNAHRGSTFQLLIQGTAALNLTLADVEDLTLPDTQRDPQLRSQPFSLIFHGPMTPVASQATYTFQHAVLPNLEIFLVPIGPDRRLPGVMRYQAIFN